MRLDVTRDRARPWDSAWPTEVPRNLRYPVKPAWWILARNVDRHANRVAIQVIDHTSGEPGAAVSYGELMVWARRLATRLQRLGVRRGDRVALYLANSPALVASYFAAWLLGATAVPSDSMASEPELARQVADAQASILLAAAGNVPIAAAVAARQGIPMLSDLQPDDVPLREPTPVNPHQDLALLIYTGGTTGEPKGAMLTHANLVANTVQFATWFQMADGDETVVSTLPLFHAGGLAGVMNVPLFAGATLLLMERFNPLVVAQSIGRWQATRFFGVPSMYVGILNDPRARAANFSSLRASRSGAAPLPKAVKEAFDDLVGRDVLVEGYGLTEASPLTHANPLGRTRLGSIGIPLPDTDARIVDETGRQVVQGELVIRGPQVMAGYWRRPAATATALQDGWLHTGDIARLDADGYFYVVDRMKDSINSGGFKIWPREVE
jgi:long-chain acyl-CoA synthetase